MPRSDSPELPSRGCFAPPPELLPLPEVWSMTVRFHKKESPFEEETFCPDCTLNQQIMLISSVTWLWLLSFTSWAGLWLEGKFSSTSLANCGSTHLLKIYGANNQTFWDENGERKFRDHLPSSETRLNTLPQYNLFSDFSKNLKTRSFIFSSLVIRLQVLLSLVTSESAVSDSLPNSKSSPQVMAPLSSQK